MKIRDFEWWIVGILGLTAFFLANIGFGIMFTEAGIERNYLDLAFQSVKIFGMEFVDEFQSPLPWQLELARWMAPAVVLYTGGKAIYYFIRREFKSVLIKYKKNHIIITSLNPKSRYLISDMLAQNKKVIVVAGLDELQKLDSVEKEGAIIVDGDITTDKFLNNIAAHRAKYFVFITDDDEKNISSAISVYNYLAKNGKDKRQTLYTHVTDDLKLNELKELNFFEEFTEENMVNSNCEIRIFSANERTSRILFNKYSPDIFTKVCSPDDEQLHIALIGSKHLVQSMLIRFARLGHYANLKKLKITLFHNEKNIVSRLERSFKYLHQLIDLEIINEELDLFDVDKFEILHKEHPFAAVYIVIEDDSLSSSVLNKLSKVETSRNMDVVLTLLNPEGILSKWYAAKKIDNINLHKFNLVEESFTKDALISEKLDELAKIIHTDYYDKIKDKDPNKASHKPWELLPLDFKNQNREQADHLFVKLRALGYTDNLEEIFNNISKDQLELLSEMEHNRWWAHMQLSGYVYAEKRDDNKKRHPDLVPYDQLTDDTKQYDRDTILNIPKLLQIYNNSKA